MPTELCSHIYFRISITDCIFIEQITALLSYQTFRTYLCYSNLVTDLRILPADVAAWSVQVGAHTDDITKCKEWRRYPSVTVTKPLREGNFF